MSQTSVYDSALGAEISTMNAPKPALWLVTFGDLLTLLLCFFLTMVTFGPLGNNEKTSTNQGVTAPTAASTQEPQGGSLLQDSGTVIANIQSDDSERDLGVRNMAPFVRSLRLELRSEDFAADTFVLSKQTQDLLERLLSEAQASTAVSQSQIENVLIEVCQQAQGSVALEQMMEQALTLGRSLQSGVAQVGVLNYRLATKGCEELRGSVVDKELPVAVITVQSKVTSNGNGR